MSDTDRILNLLRERGSRGVHTRELRTGGYSGNPSERIRDLKKLGHLIEREHESWKDATGKTRPGARYTLTGAEGGRGEDCTPSDDPPALSVAGRDGTPSRVVADREQPVASSGEPVALFDAEELAILDRSDRPGYMDADAA